MTLRRVGALIRGLPPGSPLHRAVAAAAAREEGTTAEAADTSFMDKLAARQADYARRQGLTP